MAERIVIRRYMNADEASLAQATLEGADIDAVVRGDEASRTLPGVAIAAGILLEVDEADAERARTLLDAGAIITDEERAAHPEMSDGPESIIVPKAVEDAHQNVSRAFRAAIIGVFICPGVLHLYSLWILRGAFSKWSELPNSKRTTATITVAIDALSILGIIGFIIRIAAM